MQGDEAMKDSQGKISIQAAKPLTENEEMFKALLEKHDFYYEYSDDSRVYDRGKESHNNLKRVAKELGKKYEDWLAEAEKKLF
jgi:hypothetical protein